MSKEFIVSSTRHETRVAILEDDQVVEIYYQREKEYSLAGSIHKGRVTRVLPGMQSAFVDIGLERDAFLYVSDFFEDNEEYDKIVTGVEEKVLRLEKGGSAAPAESAAPASSAENFSVPSDSSPVAAAPERSGEPAGETREARVDGRAENREPRNGDGRGGDRGGRGRRSRRRRGGPGGTGAGGLPDSKYFSPNQRPQREPSRVEPAGPVESAVLSPAQSSDGEEFAILPGESLAKYVVNDIREEAFLESPEELGRVEIAASVEDRFDTPEEAAIEEKVEAAKSVPEPVAARIEPEPLPAADMAPESEHETAESVPLPEIEIQDAMHRASQELDAAAPDPEISEPVEGEDLAEPARIPTSLTAALREQGSRYQHRVSRRIRRKMRGGPGGEERRPAGQAAPDGTEESGAVDAPSTELSAAGPAPRAEQRGDPRGGQRGRGNPRSERTASGEPQVQTEKADRPERAAPSISDLLREGQEIIVQIAKEPLGQKGARITSHIALPGRFLVYMPTVDHIGVSRKIPSDDERLRLKRILQTHRTGIPGGYIVRTAGDGKTEEELRADMMFLYNLWLDMRQKAEKRPAPQLMHHDLDVVQRILRDQLTSAFKTVWVDNEELYESVLRFVQRFQPAMVGRVKLYTRANPIFDEFGITAELEKALKPKVWLKSGGYIVINQTEALVAIDINTGKYVGKSNRLEDTIVKTNTDAIKEIVRQIRLRDLGGIIVVDFIDMDERKNRQKVMQALEEAMRVDRAPYKILQFNDFGLVAITRKRVKQSLERTLCSPCPYCESAGYVKSVQTVIGEILQEAQKIAKTLDGPDVMLRVNPEVAKVLKSNQNDFLQEIEETLGRTVMVKSDAMLHQTKFDLA